MIKGFFDGIMAYPKAFRIISSMRLWKYLLIPGLISLFLGGVIGATAWGLSDNLGHWLLSWYPFDFGRSVLDGFLMWASGILMALLAFGTVYKYLVLIIVSPFMSPLAQKVEENLTGKSKPYQKISMSESIKLMWRGLRLSLRNITRELLFVLFLFLISFIPGVGIVGSILIFIIQAFYAGFGNMDYMLEGHYSVSESIGFVKRNRGLAIGNGTVFLLLLATGIGFIFAPPLATIAATVESVKRIDYPKPAVPEEFV